jgi:hypothetical protein
LSGRNPFLAVCTAASAFLAAGCDSPPTKELEIAQSEFQRALDGDADVFAAAAVDEAEAALDTAREKVKVRDYRPALSAALDATQKARAALEASEAAKRELQVTASAVVKESSEALAILARRFPAKAAGSAPTVPAPNDCQSLLDQAQDFTQTMQRHLDEADLVSVHEEVPVVKEAVAQAKAACAPPRRPVNRSRP